MAQTTGKTLGLSLAGELQERVYPLLLEAGVKLKDARRAFEDGYVRCALDTWGHNKVRAARRLGVHRNTLGRTTDRLGMNKHRPGAYPKNGG